MARERGSKRAAQQRRFLGKDVERTTSFEEYRARVADLKLQGLPEARKRIQRLSEVEIRKQCITPAYLRQYGSNKEISAR